jgi:hypothetical protein
MIYLLMGSCKALQQLPPLLGPPRRQPIRSYRLPSMLELAQWRDEQIRAADNSARCEL